MPRQFSELFHAQAPLRELGPATLMAFGKGQRIIGKNRGKKIGRRKNVSGSAILPSKTHSLGRVYALCASCLFLEREKWRNYLEKMNYFNFLFCSDSFVLQNF